MKSCLNHLKDVHLCPHNLLLNRERDPHCVIYIFSLGFTLPVDSLAALSSGCPKLKKLFLTALRGVADKDLEPFIKNCPNLEQIDLLGVRGITSDICLRYHLVSSLYTFFVRTELFA